MRDCTATDRRLSRSGARWLALVAGLACLLIAGGRLGLAGGRDVELLGTTPGGAATRGWQHDPRERLSRLAPGTQAMTGIVDVWSRLNLRAGPGLEYPIVGKLYPGQPIQILGTVGDWYRISWNGREAWCCAYWVHTEGQAWHSAELALSLSGSGTGPYPGAGPYPGGGPGGYAQPYSGSPIGGGTARTGSGAPAWTGDGSSAWTGGGGTWSQSAAGGALLRMPLIDQNTGGGSRPGAYCGPTSVRMVLAYFGIQAGADEVALGRYGPGTPMYVPGEGATHEGMATVLQHFGLQTELQYGKSLSHLRAATAAGHPVIVGVSGNYAGFNVPGHLLVVVGVDDQGNVLVNDPAGGKRRVIPPSVMMNVWSGLFLEVWR